MRTIQRLIFLSVLFLFINTITYAADWYVDNRVASSGNGQSWATAWKNFSNINWGSILPGDYLFISGGTDSTQYNETLTVGKNGTAAKFIYIMAGKYSPSPNGHSGRVIIDGGLARSQSIQIRANSPGRKYIYIKGFELRHATQGVNIEDYSSNIVLDSLYIYDYQGQAGIMLNGASNYTIDSTVIKNCRIVSYQLYNGQTDGVYAQRCQRTLFHDNYIHQRNQDPSAHTDALQAYLTNGWVIYNNVFINDSVYSPEGGGTPLILGSEGTNPVIIYNNFLYMGGIWDPSGNQNSALWTRWYDNNPMPPTWVIHNTIVVNGPRCRDFIQEYDAVTINNILATFSTSGGMANLEENLPTAIPVDSVRHNLHWRSWSGAGFSGQFTGNGHTGTPSGWSSWVTTYGGTGVNADPLFVHNFGYEPDQGALNGELQPGSPAINQGENVEPLINWLNATYNLNLPLEDVNGNPRDNTPALGAYEYTTSGGGNNPPNQPSNPNPASGSINQPVNLTLSWTCLDPDGNPLTYDVYFGTNNNPPLTSSNQSSASFNPGQLNNNTSYYWKIVAKDNQGSTTSGPVWNFATVAAIINNPPYPPSNPNPDNGTTNQPINITLNWSCTDPEGNPITYDVYFGTNDEPPLISTNHSNPSFNPGMLNSNTTYYWKIVASDNQGATTSGLVWNFTTLYIDVTPPEIVNSELLDSVTLKIWFSEPLAQSGAQNISNYSINNGIQVLIASLSGSGVTLTTTEHTAGTYTISVINVKDLAGNQITPPNNTDQYEYAPNPSQVINLELKIFLDGPYINNSMTIALLNNSFVPFNQPYSGSPWNYYGNESVSGIPQNTVDWILLELRTNTSASSLVSRRAAFLRSDGIIVDLNGNNQITFTGVQSGYYYVVVYHRNHLAIMTKTPIQLSETSSLYDFTNSQNKAYGTQPMKSLGGGNYGLYAADGNANGNVNNSDNSSVWRPENGSVGYKKGDFDLNGGVNIGDKNEKWKLNKGKISYVPTN